MIDNESILKLNTLLQEAGAVITPSTQIVKLGEEYGEVCAAWIGITGQNPRKGTTHSVDDLVKELADVVLTGLVALSSLTGQPTNHVEDAIRRSTDRLREHINSPTEK